MLQYQVSVGAGATKARCAAVIGNTPMVTEVIQSCRIYSMYQFESICIGLLWCASISFARPADKNLLFCKTIVINVHPIRMSQECNSHIVRPG